MPKENNKMQVDIDTLKKQNVNDLLSIKELYKRIEELGEKTSQIKYIDNTLVKKIKKEYEKLKKIILDENIQFKLTNDIETINSQQLNLNKNIETINSQQLKLNNDIETINTQQVKSTNDIETINTQQVKITNDIETINSKMATNTSEIGYNNNKIDNVFVNVKFPPSPYVGAKGDGVTDDTIALQNLIDNFSHLEFPEGTYVVEHLTLKGYKHYFGKNLHKTKIKPKISSNRNFIEMDEEVVQYIRIENIWFEGIGNENPKQNGVYLKARGTAHGGLWNSMFKNIRISNFNGIQLALVSGGGSMFPIQANTFERVACLCNNHLDNDSIALLIEGQVEQSQFTQCAFGGQEQTQGTIIKFRRRRNDDGILITGADTGGNGLTFIQTYVGTGNEGINFERSTNIKWIGGYFEKLNGAININTVSNGIYIDKGEFRECGKNKGSGYIIQGDATGIFYTFKDSNLISIPDNIIKGPGNRIVENIITPNNTTLLPVGVRIADLNISNESIVVNTPGCRIGNNGNLKNIFTNFQGEREVTIISNNSSGFTIGTGGNIKVGKTIKLEMFDTITLIKLGTEWIIKNIIKKDEYM